MCLLVVAFHALPDRPLLIAANRDESYQRSSQPPALFDGTPRVLAGRDDVAGGTWLGINEYGVVVALLNRHTGQPDVAGRPSRGQLCLAALRARTAHEAAHGAAALAAATPHNPFTLVALSLAEGWWTGNLDAPTPVQLASGWFIATNGRPRDRQDQRVRRADDILAHETYRLGGSFPSSLAHLCRDHGASASGSAADALCRHGAAVGTRSSTLILVRGPGDASLWHADGPPCEAAYEPCPIPWQRSPPDPASDTA